MLNFYESGYPWIRERFGRLAGYVQLIRPFTLLAPLIAGFIGVLTPVETITRDHLVTGIYAGVTLALAQGCGQTLNQYADAELDTIIKPYRPIPQGLVSRDEALGVAWLLAIVSMGRSFVLGNFFALVVLTLLFFAVFYSLAPFSPRKVNPWVNVWWMAFSRGFLPVLAVYSKYGLLRNAFVYAVLGFIWVYGFQSTKDIDDVEGDRMFNIKTVPSEYGVSMVYRVAEACLLVYVIFALVYRSFMVLLAPVGVVAIVLGRKKSRVTENNYGWTFFYIGLAMFYLLMFFGTRGFFSRLL